MVTKTLQKVSLAHSEGRWYPFEARIGMYNVLASLSVGQNEHCWDDFMHHILKKWPMLDAVVHRKHREGVSE